MSRDRPTPPRGTPTPAAILVTADSVELECSRCGHKWHVRIRAGNLPAFVGETARTMFRLDTTHECAPRRG